MAQHFSFERSLLVAGVIAVVPALMVADAALADIPIDVPSWTEEFPKQDCCVVFIAPESLQQELGDGRVNEERCRAIRAAYPRSGIYTRSEPPRLLWPLNIPRMEGPVYLTADGKSLVALGGFVGPHWWERDTIATFQSQGQSPRTVRYHDIAPLPTLKRLFATNGSEYLAGLRSEYDPVLDTLTVTTNAGETITFDGHTGDILHYNDPFFVKHALAFLVVVGIALYFVFRSLRKQWMSTRVDHVTQSQTKSQTQPSRL